MRASPAKPPSRTGAGTPAFVAYHADPHYARFYAAEVAAPEHAAGLVTMFQDWATYQPRQNYQLAVVRREEPHTLVGCAGVRRAGLPSDHAELGVEVAPEYWGRHAYAVEIGRATLDFAFRELGANVSPDRPLAPISGFRVWPCGSARRWSPRLPRARHWPRAIGAMWSGVSRGSDGSIG